jgi:uncharacterized damage-inducible protein DinB
MSDADLAREFLEAVRARFADAHRRLAAALAHLDAAEFAYRPNRASNSIGNLVLHLCGHLQAGYLGKAASRDRLAEFLNEGPFDPNALRDYADQTFSALDAALAALSAADLVGAGRRDGPEGDLVQSLIYSFGHTVEHVGQVILLAKAQRPEAVGSLWGTPVRLPNPGGS